MSNSTAQSPSSAPGSNETSSMASQAIKIHIPSSTEYVRVVRLALLGVASRMPFSYDDVEDIKLAVSEACNNAILHANAAPGANHDAGAGYEDNHALPASIVVTITPWPDRLEISVTDEGRVPPPGLPSPKPRTAAADIPTEELRESGMGLYLMEALMDDVEHQTGNDLNTTVRMVKYVPGNPMKTTRPAANHNQ